MQRKFSKLAKNRGIMKKIITLIIAILPLIAISQEDEYTLAMSYYNNQEYKKAAPIFWQLYKERKMKYLYDYYIISLIKAEEYNKALKIAKKEAKKHNQRAQYLITLGYVYKISGNTTKSKKEYSNAIKNMKGTIAEVNEVAQNFIRFGEFKWAEKAYIKGKKLTNYTFLYEMANLYDIWRMYDKMIDCYLDLIKENIKNYSTAKNVFTTHLYRENSGEFASILERKLIERIQKDDYFAYRKLLIWFYLQEGNIQEALIQAKAYDKKLKNGGVMTYEVGLAAQKSKKYDLAQEAFNYIINQWKHSPYYWKAKFGILNTKYNYIKNNSNPDSSELFSLAQEYLNIINELGINKKTKPILLQYCHLEAFYIHNYSKAIEILDKTIKMRELKPNEKGQFMIEKADILVAANQLWAAILLYAKVQEEFRGKEIADEAAFKKAKTYFYLGKFKWAKSQFDILKGSSTKLTANDAIYYSFFINENISEDSTQTALKLYAQADRYIFARYFDSALILIDTILTKFPMSRIIDDALWLKYKIYFEQHNYKKAVEALEKILTNYSGSILTDKALYFSGVLYQDYLHNTAKAGEYYKELLINYKDSFYISEARKRYRKIIENK